jgi:plastocyanin
MNKKTGIIAAVVVVIVVAIYLIVSGGSSNIAPGAPETAGNTDTPAANPAPAGPSPAQSSGGEVPGKITPTDNPTLSQVTISMKNSVFTPSSLKIKPRTQVTWVNDDSMAHTVTYSSGNLFDSGSIPPGGSFSFTFTDINTLNYHCNFHPGMKGTIIVSAF